LKVESFLNHETHEPHESKSRTDTAGCHAGTVAQSCTLLYRRVALGKRQAAPESSGWLQKGARGAKGNGFQPRNTRTTRKRATNQFPGCRLRLSDQWMLDVGRWMFVAATRRKRRERNRQLNREIPDIPKTESSAIGCSMFGVRCSMFGPLPPSALRPPTSGLRSPTSVFRPPTSGFRPPTSGFRPPTSDLWLPASDFSLPNPPSDFADW
jgi:hypothetical protein